MTDSDRNATELAALAEELYALDPGEFTAARDQRAGAAKKEGDREAAAAVKSWKRPAPPAWAVNLLARHRRDELMRLLDLGGKLREAQDELSADQLRTVSRQRHEVVAGLVRAGRDLAAERSRPLSEAGTRQVEETLNAALANPDAAAAVASGRLVRALLHSGIGTVDLEGAVGGPRPASGSGRAGSDAPPRQGESAKEPQRRRAAESQQVKELQDQLAAAERHLEAAAAGEAAADAAVEDATERRASAEARVDELQDQLAEARRDAEEARASLRSTIGARDEARLATKAARRHATAVRTRLEELRGSS